jgi:hypothetical protein
VAGPIDVGGGVFVVAVVFGLGGTNFGLYLNFVFPRDPVAPAAVTPVDPVAVDPVAVDPDGPVGAVAPAICCVMTGGFVPVLLEPHPARTAATSSVATSAQDRALITRPSIVRTIPIMRRVYAD